MKLKLEVLVKFLYFLSSFGNINNFVNLVILLKSQFSSASISDSKIHIKSKAKLNMMKQNLFNKPYMSSSYKSKKFSRIIFKIYVLLRDIHAVQKLFSVIILSWVNKGTQQ